MNKDFDNIKSLLDELRSDYASCWRHDRLAQDAPITERDIVAEIYYRLKSFCKNNRLYVHCEIKPARNADMEVPQLKRLPKIDIGILADANGKSWLSAAMKLQDKYKKGPIEARFSSVPVLFFHTAIEVKIQSNVQDAKKDINILADLNETNSACNCFLVLLNARGKKIDHDNIQKHAALKGVSLIEYTSE